MIHICIVSYINWPWQMNEKSVLIAAQAPPGSPSHVTCGAVGVRRCLSIVSPDRKDDPCSQAPARRAPDSGLTRRAGLPVRAPSRSERGPHTDLDLPHSQTRRLDLSARAHVPCRRCRASVQPARRAGHALHESQRGCRGLRAQHRRALGADTLRGCRRRLQAMRGDHTRPAGNGNGGSPDLARRSRPHSGRKPAS